MQFKIRLKYLMLAVSVIIITTCTSHKNENKIGESAINNDSARTMNTNINAASYNEEALLRVQELQQNNIIYFDLDKYDLQCKFTSILDSHANFLRSNKFYKTIIEGHADERGTPEYNIALGERRANAVKIYLQGKGVPADQIKIISYGKEKPVMLGHNEAAYAKNRRAVIIYE